MKKHHRTHAADRSDLEEILPEYDFSRALPNKYAAAYWASKIEMELQGSVPLDAIAAFTIGFSDPAARQAFVIEIAGP